MIATSGHRGTLPLILALFLLPWAEGAAHGGPFKRSPQPADGTVVKVRGVVADEAGRTRAGVTVVLEGARRAFSYRKMRRADFNPASRIATSGEDGSFALEWPWHSYYNHFRLSAVVDVPRGAGNVDEHLLAEIDLTQRMKGEQTVLVQLTLEDPTVLDELRAFEASLQSEDHQRVYREQGKPDRVDRVPGQSGEETWWYFDRGAAYRFAAGTYVELDQFDPVVEPED
jgi:hypothetical protein